MLADHVKNKLDLYRQTNLLREQYSVASRSDTTLCHEHAGRLINFSGNDYLGLANAQAIKRALAVGAERYGLGGASSALISGYYQIHQQLEAAFADYLGRDSAILFGCGYLANLGVITTLASRDSVILSDKLCHASLIDAITLSRAKHLRYRHNDMAHLLNRLGSAKQRHKFIVTESVFSMEGDITPLANIQTMADSHDASVIVDDAHGFGVLGTTGKGIVEHDHICANAITALITPLGKAAASIGAIVSGSHELIQALRQFARSYVYTTALPPAVVYATLASLQLIQSQPWRQQKLLALIQFFIREAERRSLPLHTTDLTPIKCIVLGGNKRVQRLQYWLMQQGFWVSAIRPPTVPPNTSRVRISLSCMHSEAQISRLLDLIQEYHETHATS